MPESVAAVRDLMARGRWAEARKLSRALCEKPDAGAEQWRLRAQVSSRLGDHDDVAAACQRMLQDAPDDLPAWYNLAVAEHARGRREAAAEAYRRMLALTPGDPRAHAGLGAVLRELGQGARAEESLRTALRLDSGLVEARYQLGLLLLEGGRLDEALASLDAVVAQQPRHAGAHFYRAVCCEALGRIDDAAAGYERALASAPNLAEARRRLGRLYASVGRAEDAAAHLREAVRLRPDDATSLGYLGAALVAGQTGPAAEAEAEQCFRAAIRARPGEAQSHVAYADLLQRQGRFDEASAHLEHVLAVDPRNAVAAAERVRLHERRGDFADAGRALAAALAAHPTDPQVALAFAVVAPHLERTEHAAAHLERVLEQGTLPNNVRQELLFALGALYDRLGRYDEAFGRFLKANRLTPTRYDPGETGRLFDSLIDAYAPGVVRARAGNRTELPVFIVGMPRSGTTLVEQILAAHPQVHGAGELALVRQLVGGLPSRLSRGNPYPSCLEEVTPVLLDELAAAYLGVLQGLAPGARRVTDKMPHNFRWLGLIDQMLPGARIVHCRRDALDTCLSLYFQPISPGHPYCADLRDLGHYYRQYERLMAHWAGTLDNPVLELRYEELVAEPERVARELVAFCGLEWDPACLNFHAQGRVVNTPSYDQVRRPIYTSAVERWRRYERFLGPLRAGLDAADAGA
jgi:tetratricopeptide (TPR) repeat protein